MNIYLLSIRGARRAHPNFRKCVKIWALSVRVKIWARLASLGITMKTKKKRRHVLWRWVLQLPRSQRLFRTPRQDSLSFFLNKTTKLSVWWVRARASQETFQKLGTLARSCGFFPSTWEDKTENKSFFKNFYLNCRAVQWHVRKFRRQTEGWPSLSVEYVISFRESTQILKIAQAKMSCYNYLPRSYNSQAGF